MRCGQRRFRVLLVHGPGLTGAVSTTLSRRFPAGSWTSYGDLAELAGTAAQPTANHIAHDPSVTNAYRVLSSDGSINFKFQWHDPADTRDAMETLIGEGVEFDENDKASQAQRLGPAELEALVDNTTLDNSISSLRQSRARRHTRMRPVRSDLLFLVCCAAPVFVTVQRTMVRFAVELRDSNP